MLLLYLPDRYKQHNWVHRVDGFWSDTKDRKIRNASARQTSDLHYRSNNKLFSLCRFWKTSKGTEWSLLHIIPADKSGSLSVLCNDIMKIDWRLIRLFHWKDKGDRFRNVEKKLFLCGQIYLLIEICYLFTQHTESLL